MKSRTLFIFVLLALYAAGCNLPSGINQEKQAWIDAPLDGTELPLAPYEIVFHAYAPVNPSGVELTINGIPVSMGAINLGQSLVTIRYPWYPDQPGTYLIAVRTQDKQGKWSQPHVHTVTIAGEIVAEAPITVPAGPPPIITVTAGPPPIITVTAGPLPTTTYVPRPPVTVTVLAPPPVEPPPLAFYNNTSPQQVVLGDCGANQLTFDVTLSQPNTVSSMVVFTRLTETGSGKRTEWDEGTAMNTLPDGQFWLIVNTDSINGLDKQIIVTLSYQFVATASNGKVAGRSQVYNDVTLSKCISIK